MHEYGLQLNIMTVGTILHLLHTRLYDNLCSPSVILHADVLFVILPYAVCLEPRGATSSAYLPNGKYIAKI